MPAIDVASQPVAVTATADTIRELKQAAKQVNKAIFPDGLKSTGKHSTCTLLSRQEERPSC